MLKRNLSIPTNSPKALFLLTAAVLFVLAPLGVAGSKPKPVMGPRIRVSPPLAGNHSLIDLAIDPDRPTELIACGYRFSAPRNATVGFVYRTSDSGHEWQEVVLDDSSGWVSEESCAAGAGGRAFFMAQSAFLENGRVPEDRSLEERGEIHIYSSFDGGNSWSKSRKKGWFDHTAMAVDWTGGPHRGRMYLFGQTRDHDSVGWFNNVQVMTIEDGTNLNGPASVPAPTSFRYLAAYASSAKVLPNGNAAAVFLTRRGPPGRTQAAKGLTTHIEVFISRDGGVSLENVADLGAVEPCIGAMPSMDVDQHEGTLYVAWGEISQGACRIHIASSIDGGKSWSNPRVVKNIPDGYVPSIAANGSGVIGLFWYEKRPDCWKFAVSSNKGQAFSPPIPVSRCMVGSATVRLARSSRDVSPVVHIKTTGSGWGVERDALGFSVIASRDGLFPDRTGIVADPAGAFHVVWPEPTDQNGALWSTTIRIDNGGSEEKSQNEKYQDVSRKLALEFTNPSFDPDSGLYAFDVVATNIGPQPIRGPLIMQVGTAYSRFFRDVVVVGSDDDGTGRTRSWTLWAREGRDVLDPGARTCRRRLSFRLTKMNPSPVSFGDFLSVRVEVFSPTL